jgi:hypothetical protein
VAIPIAGSTASTISRLANLTNRHARRFLQSPHHVQIEVGQNEKENLTTAKQAVPAAIASAKGSRAIIVIGRGKRAVALADIATVAPTPIARTSVENGESVIIAAPVPIV